MNTNIEFKFDEATLALKAKRFDNAERLYYELARDTNTPAAWCGYGISKMAKLLSGQTTVDEVVYCFDKARKISPDQSQEIELTFINNSYGLSNELWSFYLSSFEHIKKANLNMWAGFALIGVSAMVGSSEKANFYQQLSGAAGTAFGAYYVDQAYGSKKKLKEAQALSLQIVNELKTAVSQFSINSPDYVLDFNSKLKAIEDNAKQYLEQKKSKPKTNTKNIDIKKKLPGSTTVLIFGILSITSFWCYGIVGLVLGIIALTKLSKINKEYNSNIDKYSIKSYRNFKTGKTCAIIGISLSTIMLIAFIAMILSGGLKDIKFSDFKNSNSQFNGNSTTSDNDEKCCCRFKDNSVLRNDDNTYIIEWTSKSTCKSIGGEILSKDESSCY